MPETVYVADLGGTKVAAAVLDRDGKVLVRKTESVDLSSTLAPVGQIARIAGELCAGGRFKYLAAGIAVPGLARHDGTVWAPNLPGWEKVPLARLLQKKLRVPVVVESDRNAAVLGETWRGAGRGKADVIALIVGTGIGAGIISGGRLLRGAHELSGCAGWMAVSEADGFEVRKYGALEAFASGPGIVRAAKNAVEAGFGGQLAEYEPDAFTAEDIAELARRGDPTSRQVYRRVGKHLGLAVANLISLFDPQVVVLSGGLMGAAELFWEELTQTAVARCQPLASRQVKIRLSGLTEGNLLGAGYLAWQSVNTGSTARGGEVCASSVKAKLRVAAK